MNLRLPLKPNGKFWGGRETNTEILLTAIPCKLLIA